MEQDYIIPIIITSIIMILFIILVLYKRQNNLILKILAYFYKSSPEKIKKDTRNRDWIVFFILIMINRKEV